MRRQIHAFAKCNVPDVFFTGRVRLRTGTEITDVTLNPTTMVAGVRTTAPLASGVEAWNIRIAKVGTRLPGKILYRDNCAVIHGERVF